MPPLSAPDCLLVLDHSQQPQQRPVCARQDPGLWKVRLEPCQFNTGLEHKQRGWLVRKHLVRVRGTLHYSRSTPDHQGYWIERRPPEPPEPGAALQIGFESLEGAPQAG